MSDHVEWATAGWATARSRLLSAEQANEELAPEEDCHAPVLVLDTGSALLAIEGTRGEIAALGRRLLFLADTYRGAEVQR